MGCVAWENVAPSGCHCGGIPGARRELELPGSARLARTEWIGEVIGRNTEFAGQPSTHIDRLGECSVFVQICERVVTSGFELSFRSSSQPRK